MQPYVRHNYFHSWAGWFKCDAARQSHCLVSSVLTRRSRRLSRWLTPPTASLGDSPSHPENKTSLFCCFGDALRASLNLFQPDQSPTYHTYLEMQLLNGRDVLFAEIIFLFYTACTELRQPDRRTFNLSMFCFLFPTLSASTSGRRESRS